MSIEHPYDELVKDFKSMNIDKKESDSEKSIGIPEEDVTSFCLCLKSELGDHVSKVSLSKRLT